MQDNRQKRISRRRKQVRRQKLIIAMAAMTILVTAAAAHQVENKEMGDKVVAAGQGTESKQTAAKAKKGADGEGTAGSKQKAEAKKKSGQDTEKLTLEQVRKEAEKKGYPEEVIGLLDKNAETIGFVQNYGKKRKQVYEGNIKKDLKKGEIPHLLQWDERWGYASYGTSIMAVSGCGPTCMAMVVAGLTQDPSVTPIKMAKYAMEHNYVDGDNNTYWAFMETAGADWNVSCYGGMLGEEQVKAELEAGHPIVCSMGPGEFTQNGHFIVLTGYSDGRVRVNDPFSVARTEKEWVFAEIANQIKAMWVYSVD